MMISTPDLLQIVIPAEACRESSDLLREAWNFVGKAEFVEIGWLVTNTRGMRAETCSKTDRLWLVRVYVVHLISACPVCSGGGLI